MDREGRGRGKVVDLEREEEAGGFLTRSPLALMKVCSVGSLDIEKRLGRSAGLLGDRR